VRVFFDYSGGAPRVIYLKVVQNDPKLLDFGLINSLSFSKKPSTCKKMLLGCAALRKGFRVRSYFLESSTM
jgi:hypothetical protein